MSICVCVCEYMSISVCVCVCVCVCVWIKVACAWPGKEAKLLSQVHICMSSRSHLKVISNHINVIKINMHNEGY